MVLDDKSNLINVETLVLLNLLIFNGIWVIKTVYGLGYKSQYEEIHDEGVYDLRLNVI